jgi:hypothetical protein
MARFFASCARWKPIRLPRQTPVVFKLLQRFRQTWRTLRAASAVVADCSAGLVGVSPAANAGQGRFWSLSWN